MLVVYLLVPNQFVYLTAHDLIVKLGLQSLNIAGLNAFCQCWVDWPTEVRCQTPVSLKWALTDH